MTTSTIHRITVNAPNPSYDGRCKYGIDSIKTFKAGTLVSVHSWREGKPWDARIMLGDDSRSITGNVAASLYDVLCDAEPKTVREIIFCRGGAGLNIHEDLLQAMFENGDISMEQIDAAITRVFARWDGRF